MKKLGLGCLAVIAVIIIIGIIGAATGSGNKGKSVQEAFNAGKDKAKADIAQVDFKGQDVTEQTVRSALIKLDSARYSIYPETEITKVEVAGTASAADVSVTFNPKNPWSAKDTMNKSADTTVEVMKRLFVNAKVAKVTVVTDGSFTDQYGKSAPDTAIRIMLTKETASKIDWGNFADMVFTDYKKLLSVADEAYVHPAIMKELNSK